MGTASEAQADAIKPTEEPLEALPKAVVQAEPERLPIEELLRRRSEDSAAARAECVEGQVKME